MKLIKENLWTFVILILIAILAWGIIIFVSNSTNNHCKEKYGDNFHGYAGYYIKYCVNNLTGEMKGL